MMLRKNGYIDYFILFFLVTKFCQFRGGGGYKQWFFPKEIKFYQI